MPNSNWACFARAMLKQSRAYAADLVPNCWWTSCACPRGDEDKATSTNTYKYHLCNSDVCQVVVQHHAIFKSHPQTKTSFEATLISHHWNWTIPNHPNPTCQYLETSSRSLSHTWSHGKRIKNKAVAYFRHILSLKHFQTTHLPTNISPTKALLKMIFLFPQVGYVIVP